MSAEFQTGEPFTGHQLKMTQDFLQKYGISYEPDIEYTINYVNDNGQIISTGSLAGKVLKCFAVSPEYRGEGLCTKMVSGLISKAFSSGITHLFLFTKPEYKPLFSGLGFYEIISTNSAILMENRRYGIRDYLSSLEHGTGIQGAVVANCNPFTNGHLYLMETAAKQCDTLHVFILSEDKSEFSSSDRYQMVRNGTKHISNLILHQTSDYLISSATFPAYFLKDKAQKAEMQCELDLEIFCRYFSKELNITKRFAGTEPFCSVTNFYNQQMKLILPKYGIEVVEIPRLKVDGAEVSASYVRKLISQGRLDQVKKLIPLSTYQFLLS